MNTELKKFDELQSQITLFVAPVKEIKVSDDVSSANASKIFRDLSDFEKKVEARRKELVSPLNDAVSQINEYAKDIKRPLSDAKAFVSAELIKFEKILEIQRQEALRIEREEKIKREVELQKEIERQRLEAEAKIKEIQDDADSMAMFAASDDAAEAKAKALEESAKIKATLEAEASRQAFEAKKEYWDNKKEISDNKVSGTRRTWTFEILDLEAVPMDYKTISLNEKMVKKMIAAGIRNINGVRIYQELSITSR